MARTATIQARIDSSFKDIPFELRLPEIPNELTAETLHKSELGEELHEVGSVDELFTELNKATDDALVLERTGSHSELFKK
jgi:antitoxin component of RelBE/YafQ-DinJ toxin-antitoxin module